jgi:ribose-phosphate pyrophosphokinase
MKYLNLTKGYEPFNHIQRGYGIIEYETFTFNGGEPHIKIKLNNNINTIEKNDGRILITIRINSFNDLGLLFIAVDSIRKISPDSKLSLFMPYFPGARQDRVMVDGEPLTSGVYVKLLDSLKFESITSFDVHSDVVAGMFGVLNTKFINMDNHKFTLDCFKDIYPKYNDILNIPYLISPDAGANKKVHELGKFLSMINPIEIVKCDKTRNVKTGLITNFMVHYDDLGGKDCVIVDDICDGGGTFLGLAKELKKKNSGDLYLIVSHGIFSNGVENLLEHFKCIYTTDSIGNVIQITTEMSRIVGQSCKYHKLASRSKLKVIKII